MNCACALKMFKIVCSFYFFLNSAAFTITPTKDSLRLKCLNYHEKEMEIPQVLIISFESG